MQKNVKYIVHIITFSSKKNLEFNAEKVRLIYKPCLITGPRTKASVGPRAVSEKCRPLQIPNCS